MKTLIEAVESWIDDRIMAQIESSEKDHPKWMKIARIMQDVKQMEEIHVRDANRIAELERKILTLENSTGVEDMVTLTERLDIIESTADDALANAEEAQSIAESTDNRIDDQEYRIDELESLSNDTEIDADEIERNVRSGVEDFIVDAVRAELDAVDFRVTIER